MKNKVEIAVLKIVSGTLTFQYLVRELVNDRFYKKIDHNLLKTRYVKASMEEAKMISVFLN